MFFGHKGIPERYFHASIIITITISHYFTKTAGKVKKSLMENNRNQRKQIKSSGLNYYINKMEKM
jgi:hypothetical protein